MVDLRPEESKKKYPHLQKMFGCGLKKVDSDEKEYAKRFRKTKKLLLLGTGGSGKSTIIKQMKILHSNGFSNEEKKEKIPYIKQNIHESIYDIIYSMDKIQPPVKLEKVENRESVEFILKLGPEEPQEYTEEYFNHIKKLWKDQGVQQTFQCSNEYQLIDSAQHFLDRIDEIKHPNYIPTLQDILFCRIRTISISDIAFSIPLPKSDGGGTEDFVMVDVGDQRGERRKWIQVFDGMLHAIVFVIAASDFDQTLPEDEDINQLREAFTLFGDVCGNKFLRHAMMVVFLNKLDIFRRKIESGRNLAMYFPEFTDYFINAPYKSGKYFLTDTLKEIAHTASSRNIFLCDTVAIDTENVRSVFNYVREMLIRMELKCFSPY